MKQYIKVDESRDHYCNACGKRYDDSSLEKKILYDISFVQDCGNGNVRSQSFRLCWNCTKELAKKMEVARHNSICKHEDDGVQKQRKRINLKELFDSGIQYLEYGGQIVCTNDGGVCHYDLYKDDDIEYGLLLCDGESVVFGDWSADKKFIIGTSDFGKQIYLSKREFELAVFK